MEVERGEVGVWNGLRRRGVWNDEMGFLNSPDFYSYFL